MPPPIRHRGAGYPVLVIGSLILGLGTGSALRIGQPTATIGALVDTADVIGTMWVNAIRMTVIPLIVPLLVGAIAGASSGRDAGRLGIATIGAFILLVETFAVAAALAAPLLLGGLPV